MNDDDRKREKRFRLKGWHVILLAIVVLVGAFCLHVVIRRGETARRLAALRAAGYPTSLAELAEYNKLPEGARNAAEVYERAFEAFVRATDDPNLPLLGKGQWPDGGVPLPEPTARAISKCLASNQQCLALLHEAGAIEHCRYDSEFSQGVPNPRQEKRYCAQLLNLAIIYHANKGDTEAAVACIKDGLRLGDSLRRDPALIHYLVRIACTSLTLGGLERSLSLTAFTDQQLADLSDTLSRIGGTFDLAETMITERCYMIEMCRDPSRLGGFGPSVPIRLLPGTRGTWLADTLDFMEARVEASRLPPRERLTRFRAIDNEVQQLSFLHTMTKILMPALTRVAELDVRLHAHIDMAMTALAIERYRLATGKVPERLEELVPQYIKEVPTDPFDGKPIRYKRTEPGYLLYSILEDGQDNGGKERSPTDRNQPYDWPFIVTR